MHGITGEPAAIGASIERAWEQWLLRSRRPATPHANVWASAWRPCERRMVYELTVPDQQLPFDATVLARFRRGDDRERDLLVDLARIGRDAEPSFDLVAQQERFELKGRAGQVIITGKVDARLRLGDSRTGAPMEVKAWHPSMVERIETFDDVFQNPWTRSGGYQLLSYLYGANEPYGFLLLDRSGVPRLVVVELTDVNLERMEEFLTRAERAVAHAKAGTLPDFIDDAAECKRCPFFGTACQPPLTAIPTQVLTDPVLEADLERWWALREAGREWASLDDRVKKRLRGIESGVAGHFSVTGKWGAYTKVEVPAEMKQQYTVVDPKGRFLLEIERL